MCETPSPARTNAQAVENPPGTPAHAGFRSPAPEGAAASTAGCPSLGGWPRQLAWSEFREIAARPSGETEDAQVSVQLRPGRVAIVRENGRFRLGEMVFQMRSVPARTWVVTSSKSATLLAHEQGHYDIVGLCYRDLMAELRGLRESSRNRLLRAVRRVMGEHDRRADGLSRQYDSSAETNHGRNAQRQRAWQAQIQACRRSGARLTAPE